LHPVSRPAWDERCFDFAFKSEFKRKFTMLTKEIVFGTSTNFSTVGTDLASHERINLLNFNSFDVGFVLNKTLQLVKTPITEHSVESFAFSLLPNSFKVFHTNLVSFIVGNNAFADVVISPCHELFFTTTKLLQESLSTSCAFGLEFTTQEHEFVFILLVCLEL